MHMGSSCIRSTSILRWAFALIVAAATLAGAPCLAFADGASDNSNDTVQAVNAANDDPGNIESSANDSEEPASYSDASAPDNVDPVSGATTEGESTEAPNADDERFANNDAPGSETANSSANGSDATESKTGDSGTAPDSIESTNQGAPGSSSTKTNDKPTTSDTGVQQGDKPGKATAPSLLVTIEEKSSQDEPAAAHRTSRHTVVNAAPTPQFTCLDAYDQPATDEGRENGIALEDAPTPASPSRSALPNKNAPAPATPASSWSERHASGGQAYDDLAIILETEIPSITYCQAPCAPSRNIHADGAPKGPKRCRSPSSIGR